MLLRISLIIAILAGAGVIVVTQLKVREHVGGIITVRDQKIAELIKETARAQKAESDLTSTKGTLAKTARDLANTQSDLTAMTAKASDAETRNAAIVKDLEKAREDKKAAQQDLARFTGLGLTVEQIQAAVANLKKFRDMNGILEEEKKILIKVNAQQKKTIEGLLGENEDMLVILPTGLKGTVKVVDPKWNFVVLDIGEKQGVLQHGIMLVHRNSKLVGKVKIMNVMQDRCIANVMPGWKLSDIEEGDQVLY